MKNRFTQYVLIILTIILWGGIAYKIYRQISAKDEVVNVKPISTFVTKKTVLHDSFSIKNNYENPFIEVVGNELSSREEDERQSKEEQLFEKADPPKVEWPAIKFFGSVVNHNKPKVKLYLLNIANNDYLMKNSDEIKGIKITKVFKDSINMTYKTATKTFYKQ